VGGTQSTILAESDAVPSGHAAGARAQPAKVWIYQPHVEHYRIPIFDGLVQRGRADGAYDLTVLGTLQNGKTAYGGEARPYFVHCPLTTDRFLKKITYFCWPGAEQRIREGRPDVVVMGANPRNSTCWKLPGVIKAQGGAVVGWSKVHSYGGVPPWIMGRVKGRFYPRFDRMICYGDSSLKELLGLGYPPNQAVVAQNTIDTRRIFNESERIAARAKELRREAGLEDKKILLCVGRFDPDKRHQDLLDVWPRLRELDPSMVMVLVGGGQLLEEVRTKAAALDPSRIMLTGRVAEGDDYAWIAASDLTVYPGAVGLAINQSLALGRPTIIADERGADSEIVEHAITGWRYPRGNLDELFRAVRSVLADAESAQRVTTAARTLMRDKVTIDNMIGAIDRSIRLALEVRDARRRAKA
jgi:glycosyltransferase involved in cell wall biosynthesis